MKNEHPSGKRRTFSLLKIVSYAGIFAGFVVIVGALTLMLFIDPFVNRFIKPRITTAIAKAYPEYTVLIGEMKYGVLKNRFQFYAVSVKDVDHTFSSTIGPLSVSGIDWTHLLWGGDLTPKNLTNVIINVQDIQMSFRKSKYELYCERLHISVPDSEFAAETFDLIPLSGDEEFFKESAFRRTRFRFVSSQFTIKGLEYLGLLEGKKYAARTVQLHDFSLDILINKDKPVINDSVLSPMPNEILSSIDGILKVGRLRITNGSLKYGERFAVAGTPAVITFDNIRMTADGISNHGGNGSALVIQTEGKFMKAGTMKVHMSIPVSSKDFSYTYSGSLSRTDLNVLNRFLETAEEMRIKNGVLDTAAFEITVASGRASGYLRAIYKDLSFALINKKTGSDKGFFNMVASFIANTFKIHGTNQPDKSGAVKMGTVNYTKKREEYFMEFTWFALRSGVRDIVGF